MEPQAGSSMRMSRVFQSTERDIHRLLEQLFLAQFFVRLFLCRWFFPRLQEDPGDGVPGSDIAPSE